MGLRSPDASADGEDLFHVYLGPRAEKSEVAPPHASAKPVVHRLKDTNAGFCHPGEYSSLPTQVFRSRSGFA